MLRITISPQTTSLESISISSPLRITVVVGAEISASFSRASAADFSMYVAIPALMLVMTIMKAPSTMLPSAILPIAAAISSKTTKLQN
uniref:Uncharacterized protein n=1 Tax=Babesia bovis TaxID=5865 RepID=S6C8L4_BABBO|nr:hypothetical protein [Babesia bovis]